MSTNRVNIDSNGRHFSANSFNRFGDDLCELILSYLTFEDKIRLQSVSKQWNRTILNKQFAFKYCYDTNCMQQDELNFHTQKQDKERFNVLFKKLLQKCFIKEIDLAFVRLDNTLIDIICEFCPLLTSMTGYFSGLQLDSILRFGGKFGNQMKGLHFKGYYTGNEFILTCFCPNIIILSFDDFRQDMYRNLKPMIKLKKLCFKTHAMDSNIVHDIHRIAPNLKSLEINSTSMKEKLNIDITSIIPMSKVVIFKMINLIPTDEYFVNLSILMPNLQVLKVSSPIDINHKTLKGISRIRKITELVIISNQPFDKSFSNETLYYLFENLPKLKKFKTNSIVNVSHELMDKMIEIANNRQKDKIIIDFESSENPFPINSYVIPKNLQINFNPLF